MCWAIDVSMCREIVGGCMRVNLAKSICQEMVSKNLFMTSNSNQSSLSTAHEVVCLSVLFPTKRFRSKSLTSSVVDRFSVLVVRCGWALWLLSVWDFPLASTPIWVCVSLCLTWADKTIAIHLTVDVIDPSHRRPSGLPGVTLNSCHSHTESFEDTTSRAIRTTCTESWDKIVLPSASILFVRDQT